MIAREQTAVRNVGLLLMLRGLLIAGGVVVAAVVPRLMGPTGYGQVALLVALSFWFTLTASLGFTQVMGRHVPHFGQTGDDDGLRGFFGRLLAIRVVAGLLAAGLYLVVTATWLRDLDALAMAILAVAVFVRAPAGLFFSLYLSRIFCGSGEPWLSCCLGILWPVCAEPLRACCWPNWWCCWRGFSGRGAI